MDASFSFCFEVNKNSTQLLVFSSLSHMCTTHIFLKTIICLIILLFNRYLYFNFRETEPAQEGDEEDYLRLKENLEVNMIDLQTRKVVPGVSYKGHKGFSEYPAWYICLDTSDDIVARLV